MALSFGTSGIRGLETDLTDESCARFARAFMRHVDDLKGFKTRRACVIAGDLRKSTPRIKEAVAQGLAQEGVEVWDAGMVPTPALAFECKKRDLPGIMVTGSHIPADRNGIKFYFPYGEILKADEAPILEHEARLKGEGWAPSPTPPRKKIPGEASFVERYAGYFGPTALQGMRIVFYEHSSAARDVYCRILEKLGAQVIRTGRSEEFVPVDTEALENVKALSEMVLSREADALVSTDGDGDRPLLLDERGKVVRGDQIGILAAAALHSDSVSTPVSSSTALELALGALDLARTAPEIRRCRIGSPFVVEEMEHARKAGKGCVTGFEANGGFLLGTDISGPGARALVSLLTRDSVLPVLLVLRQAKALGKTLGQLVASLPARYTASDLIRPFELDRARALLERFKRGGQAYFTEAWGARLGQAMSVDLTDGVRVTFERGDILHFRPSGNAPEFRIYSEAGDQTRAESLNREAKDWVLGL